MARVRGVIAASMRVEVDVARARIDIDEHRPGADAQRSTLAVATQDSGVVMTSSPGPTPASASAISMRAGGRNSARAPAGRRTVLRQLRLELLHLRAAGDPARAQHLADGGDRRLVDRGARERQEIARLHG